MRVGEKLQRVFRGLRLHRPQPQPLEHLHRHLAQLGLVFDHQDDLLAELLWRYIRGTFLPPRQGGRRQRQV